ncbi:fatty acid desaturase 2-like protein FADS2B [Castor canadensis]
MGHLSMFKKSKWNHLMQKFVMCHLKGLSANWWNYQHFQHHVKPNIYPKDPDIDVGPLFLLGDSQPVKYGKKKIKYIDYEKQHLYFYMVGLPLLVPIYFNLQSVQVMYLRKYWVDIAWVISFYIRYFITFGPFYGIFGTVLLIFFIKFLESPWIVFVTQMSHIPMKMSGEENRDWLSTQVLATCNIEQSFFNNWFTGHLNFHTEHHLFPTMPRHNYHKVSPLVKSLCAKHGLQYVSKPMLKAFGDIVRALKKSATLWMDAYYE